LGQTAGFHVFADQLRTAGHTVHTPDLFGGRTFERIDDGMAFAEELGFPDEIVERGTRAAEKLATDLVYAGFSLGVVPAQKLAQACVDRWQHSDDDVPARREMQALLKRLAAK
jgi:hypothetical protein